MWFSFHTESDHSPGSDDDPDYKPEADDSRCLPISDEDVIKEPSKRKMKWLAYTIQYSLDIILLLCTVATCETLFSEARRYIR